MMLDERKIGLGLGYLSVEGRGAAMVISAAASKVERIPQKQFTFKAKLCDSAEELQKSFSAAMSVSASAHGADLGANGSLSKATDASHFDAYYMMELEFREECASLDSLRDILEILDPSIREELESLDTVEKWEEFYRTKGSHIINSVIYGRKLIIIVSLNHKVQNEQLRRMLEAKAGFPGTGDAKASLESNLKALAKENISSVQIHSIGDSNPDYLGDIDKLAALKEKIDNFVNPVPKQKAKPEISAKLSDATPRLCTSETPGGVIIAYSTCPYIDFLNKQTPKYKQIEMAYEKMLQATNRSSRYLEELARCQGRLDTLLRSVDFYLTGHDGAFTLKHPTEVAAGHLRKFLGKHTNTLRDIAREVVAETTGLTEEGRRHRTLRLEAKECLGLRDEFTSTLATCGIKEARILLDTRLSLIEKFETMLNEQEGRTLGLKQRFIDVQTVFEETEAQKKTYLPSLKLLRARFDNEVALYLEKRADLVKELMGIYNNLIVVLRRSKQVAVISEEEKSLFAKLLESLKQAVGKEEDQDQWLSELAVFSRDMVTDFKPIFEEDTDAETGSKIIISRALLQEYLLPLEELLSSRDQLIDGFQPDRAAYASEDVINSVSKELDTTISFLENRYSSNFGPFKKITEEFVALRLILPGYDGHPANGVKSKAEVKNEQ